MTIQANPPAFSSVDKVDLVTVTIDDIEVKVPKKGLAIRAAEQIGVQIPRFRYYPLLDLVAACRQRLVEVLSNAGNGRGMPKLDNLLVVDRCRRHGDPDPDQLAGGRQGSAGPDGVPADQPPAGLPGLRQGRRVPAAEPGDDHGRGESRFHQMKRTYPKPLNVSAQVLLHRERRVLCGRCTRFSEEIAGDPFIELLERGALSRSASPRRSRSRATSPATPSNCPVGALTSAAYRFRSRPFDLVSVPSVAEHDASGAAIRVDHLRGKAMRRLARDDPQVNEEWISRLATGSRSTTRAPARPADPPDDPRGTASCGPPRGRRHWTSRRRNSPPRGAMPPY